MATSISKNDPMVVVVPPSLAMVKIPAMPAIKAENINASSFIFLTGTPTLMAVDSFSPMALL